MWYVERETGAIYTGDMRTGDREATEQEVALWEQSIRPSLQQLIDAECQKHGIANEVTLEGLLGGLLALAILNGKTIEQLAAENSAFKLGMTLRATFAQWRAQA